MAITRRNARRLAAELEAGLRARGTPERAAGSKAYLKSDLEFIGVDTPTLRRSVLATLRRHDLERPELVELPEADRRAIHDAARRRS